MNRTFFPRRLALMSLSLVASATLLSACAPLLMGGAAATTVMVATDRRSSGAQLDDQGIELRAASNIRDALGSRVRVSVTSFNRRALITGEAASERDKALVGEAVRQTPNVQAVYNEVGIANSPSLKERTEDSLLTGKVKAGLVAAKDIPANSIKVVTERGTVYLMGMLSQSEAERATSVARTTSGVQRVVRLIEILPDEEINRLKTKTE
ncbi:MAG: BON domain-containing protein [Hydrogenophaga sp.]|jgi:osmotically-inducible protein OsmY|uniref:BON domain-containing protein n=2 Tax=Hydrogenophaga sp. TaxID=1904254 RepID=UPI002A36B2AA|nr:BON domain-containing protein [Hydrogenophaga sp.]MDX9970162.1 BON domain-containing protein [Hydrogenophaga sp.]